MRRTLPFIGIVLLLLALGPPAAAQPSTLIITEDTTLTADHLGSIEIAADDVTLDCAGFSVIGPSEDPSPVDGVLVDHHSGVTVRNCVAQGFVNGFKLQGVTDSVLVGNTAIGNEGNGFYAADRSTGNVFRDNVATGNVAQGITFDSHSNRNLLEDNVARSNGGNGYFDFQTRGNTFKGNMAAENAASGFGSTSSADNRFIENIARANINGFAFADSRGYRLARNVAHRNSLAGFALLERSRRIRLIGNVARKNRWGWQLDRANENVLRNNSARSNEDNGFALGRSSENVLRRNQSLRNFRGFFVSHNSNGNVFRLNRANRNNDSAGFGVERSDGNFFFGNRAMGNRWGFYVWFGSSHNKLIRNMACRNSAIDADDDGSGVSNTWEANAFCRSDI